jgi:hypothetical protein
VIRGVIGANMGCEFFVALQLEVAHHFIERFADGRTRRFEAPATFGTSKASKTLLLGPYQLPAHDRLRRSAPNETFEGQPKLSWVLTSLITVVQSGNTPLQREQKTVSSLGTSGRCIKGAV